MTGNIGLRQARESIRTSLWFVPTVAALIAILLSQTMLEIDRQYDIGDSDSRFFFAGTGDSAARILSTTAMAVLTVTGVVFSVTMLVLQQASQQLSPRVLRTFLRDPGTQVVLGVYIGTFLYSLLVLRQVRTSDVGARFVPSLSMAVGMLLVLLALALFIYYINHVAQAIRPSTVIGRIAGETRAAIQHIHESSKRQAPHPPAWEPSGKARVVRWKRTGGVITGVDTSRLEAFARDSGCIVEFVPVVGDFVRHGGEVVRLWGPAEDVDEEEVLAAVGVNSERSMEQDPAFGFRQLVDIGELALSPGVNDPTTAIQALDRIHDLLGRLLEDDLPSGYHVDDDGRLLLILRSPAWADYVALALDELRMYGTGSIQVMRRIRFILEDLLATAGEEHRPPLRRQLMLLDESIRRGFPLEEDRLMASRPSGQGHGPD